MKKEVNDWIDKINKIKKGEIDLSKDEDLSIGIMNIISLEEHFYFTAMKTGNQKYLNMLNAVREIRIKMLKKIVRNPVGEEWCISKHLLASSMRLIEVGTKELKKGKKEEANDFFKSAFELYSLFFAINLNLVEPEKLKGKNIVNENKISGKFSEIVKRIVDCCKEW